MTDVTPRRDSRAVLLLGAIFVLALVLRWWGNRFGLPATYHPDEHQYVDAAVAALGGDLNPGRFNNPTLLKYALALVYAVWYAVGRAAGSWPDVAAWQAAVAADPTTAHVIARGLVGVLGAGTCLVVAAIGRRLRDRTTGLLAAAFLAVAFMHARDSHYAVNDVPAALLTTLAVAIALKVRAGTTDRDRARDLVLGGAIVGLAAATKYTALVAALPLGIAWLAAGDGDAGGTVGGTGNGTVDGAADVASEGGDGAAARRLGLDAGRLARRLIALPVALAALALVAAFLAAVPFAVLDWPAFRADVVLLATRGREGFKGLQIDPAPGWIFYLKSLGWGLGWPMLGAAIVGIGLALGRRRADDVIVVLLPIVLWGYLGSQLNMFARFMLPAVPLLCVVAADAVVVGAGVVGRWREGRSAEGTVGGGGARGGVGGDRAMRSHRPYAWGMVAMAGVVVGAPSLVAAVRHNVLLGRTDTRGMAREWIVEHVPAGAAIVLQSGGPELDGLGYEVESVGTLELPERALDDWIRDATDGGRRPAFLVTSTFSTERRLLDREDDAAARAWYADVAGRLEPIATFRTFAEGGAAPPFVFDQVYGPCTDLWRIDRPGPGVAIFPLR